ncbi:RNA binding motif protein 12Ba [Eucyclogobius newberryi]|uniref:RNA binding motif protein 12Ba n=1 Tax=Eucyclogobius newberryi TaxID=166745 RepID=UPI003B5B2E37
MSTILQLRGLDTKAGAEDIRSFFGRIHIPEGGVFIIGGPLGEAFIAFNTEEEGMLAMQQCGLFLKDSKVDLHISSMVELEHKLDAFLKRRKSFSKLQKHHHAHYSSNEGTKPVDPNPVCKPPFDTMQFDVGAEQTVNMDTINSKNKIRLGICTLLQGLPSSQIPVPRESPAEPPAPNPANPGFIRLFGLPCTATKQDICHFFQGLNVKEVLLNVSLGVSCGCLVQFDSIQEATAALSFNQSLLGTANVEVRTATLKMWRNALQEHEDGAHGTLQQSPLKDTMNYSKVSEWPRKTHNTGSIQKTLKKLNCQTTNSSDTVEYIVMVSHLPVNIVKTEIKELFGCPNIAHKNVLHLLNSEGNKTDRVFVKFDKQEDYDYAINLSGCHVGSKAIEVSPITKEEMNKIMKSQGKPPKHNTQTKTPHQYGKMDSKDEQSHEANTRRCLYIRNMPADVRRSQIKGLFTENKLKEEDITLLHDSDGMCIGEAVVQFQSETNVALALMHHGREFLGSKILLTPINVKQMENILANN